MKYLSVCSGIEAATAAWHDLGWTPVAFSEIEPFPSAVLKHHYPNVPNVGDMTKFKEWNLEPINLLVGGTPCQSFSVAGLRKGLDDPRGNLMLTFLAIAERERPKWIVWENVPGVLSSNGGRDFGTFLAALGELGYGWAYRVLDAQWFGVAQRRRRVFVVGCLGDQAGAAAVLFESESVQRNPAPSREKGQGAARGAASGTYLGNAEGGAASVPYLTCSNINVHINNQTPLVGESVAQPVAICTDMRGHGDGHTAPTLRAKETANDFAPMVAVAQPVAIQDVRAVEKAQNGRGWNDDGTAYTVDTHATQGVAVARPIAIQGTLIGRGDNAGPQGSGVDERGSMFTLTKTDVHAVAQPVVCVTGDRTHALTTRSAATEDGTGRGTPIVPVAQPVATAMQVRRLTPTECERLQGFPDGYTNIPWRKKDEAPDGPRYKALGNSMAVPCMKWIGERIQAATARQEVQP